MSKKSTAQGFKRFFKGAASKQVELPASNPTPRSLEEINKEYTQLCLTIGNTQVKARAVQQELDYLFRKADSLGNENQARLDLDAKAKEAAGSGETTESLAPETSGVDANV